MESYEFRDLLLHMRSGLVESAIPHRTKLSELVICAWKEHFQVLKCELAVGSNLFGASIMLTSFLGRDGASLLYHGHLV